MELDILPGRRMRWTEKTDKKRFGSRKERHELGQFILRYCQPFLPVRAWVAKLQGDRKFSFAPVLVNGRARNVVMYYKNFMILMGLRDTAMWIQAYIISHRLYENIPMYRVKLWYFMCYSLLARYNKALPSPSVSCLSTLLLVSVRLGKRGEIKGQELRIL